MFLPIGDTPNPPGFRAWATWAIIAANIAIYVLLTLPLSFLAADPADPLLGGLVDRVLPLVPPGVDPRDVLASLTAWDLVVEAHGFKPGRPETADLFASLFLHANLAHVAGNMLFLWIYGDNVEHRLGRLGFLATYLASGVIATLAFAAVASDPHAPLVGASGAISGVLGCYFVLFPLNRIRVFVALFPFLVDTWLVPSRIVLGLYVLVDNLLPVLAGGGGGVAYGAHLGGFVAGLAVAFAVDRMGVGRHTPAADEARVHLRRASAADERALALVELGEALADDDPVAAFQHLVAALRLTRDPDLVARARRALGRLPLDPRLRARLA